MRSLFSSRERRLYLGGQTVSLLGDRVLFLAMGIWTKTLTGSNGAAGLTFFFFVAPSLLAPLAGALVDRLPRRTFLILVNLATGLVVCSLVLVNGRGQVWLIYLVMFLYGASATVLSAGGSAMLTMLFASDELGSANAYLSTVGEGCRLFAPLAGAGLFVVIGGAALGLIDAATFFIAAASLAAISVKEAAAAGASSPWRSYVAAGVRHLVQNAPLRQMTAAVALAMLFAGLLESIGFAVVSQGLHRAPPFLGVLISAQGVGALAGALTAARIMRRIGAGGLIAAGLAVLALGVFAWTASDLALVIPGFILTGLGVPWLIIGYVTAIQRLTPMALQGRVDAAASFLLGTPQAVSIAAGAGLVTVVNYRILLAMSAAVFASAGLGLISRRQQRHAFIEAAAVSVAAADPAGASQD